MRPKRRSSIGDIIALIMLKILLRAMKKSGQASMKVPPPPFLALPAAGGPKNDLLLENKRIVYRCGMCGQRFVLKSDINLVQKTVAEWMEETRKHECYDSKKNLD